MGLTTVHYNKLECYELLERALDFLG